MTLILTAFRDCTSFGYTTFNDLSSVSPVYDLGSKSLASILF